MYVISNKTGNTVQLTSYQSPHGHEQLLHITKIQKVGQATSAASSFFNPITISNFKKSFVDGAIGVNNPVYKVQSKAQDIQPSSSLKDKIKCLVLIKTSVPLLTPFKDNLISISQSLLAIAIETEKIAEQFSYNKSRLDNTGQYYQFNMLRGLENIRLEDLK